MVRRFNPSMLGKLKVVPGRWYSSGSAGGGGGGVTLLDNTKSARVHGCATNCWASAPSDPYASGQSGPMWDLFERENAWSIGIWVKHNSGTTYRTFCGKMDYLVQGFQCGADTDASGNPPKFEIRDDNANTIYGIGTTSIGDGDWHFVVFTYDGTSASSAIKIYVDGGADESTGSGVTLDGSIKTDLSTVKWFTVGIGVSYSGGYVGHWNGWIDELSIWDVALSESEAAECYTATTAKTPDLNTTSKAENLVHWWRMGDGEFDGTDDSWLGKNPGTNRTVNLVYDMSTSTAYAHNTGAVKSSLTAMQRSRDNEQIDLVTEAP